MKTTFLLLCILFTNLLGAYHDARALDDGLALGRSFPGTLFLFDNDGNEADSASLVNYNGQELIITAAHNFAKPGSAGNQYYLASITNLTRPVPLYTKTRVFTNGAIGSAIDANKIKQAITECGGIVRKVTRINFAPGCTFYRSEGETDRSLMNKTLATDEVGTHVDTTNAEQLKAFLIKCVEPTSPENTRVPVSYFADDGSEKEILVTNPDLCVLSVDSPFGIDLSLLPALPTETYTASEPLELEAYGLGEDPHVVGQSRFQERIQTLSRILSTAKQFGRDPIPSFHVRQGKNDWPKLRCFAIKSSFRFRGHVWGSFVPSDLDQEHGDDEHFDVKRRGTTTGVIISGMSGGPAIERRSDGTMIFRGVISESGINSRLSFTFAKEKQYFSKLLGSDDEYERLLPQVAPQVYQHVAAVEGHLAWIKKETNTEDSKDPS